jgi:hypothetical protein
MHRLQSAVRPLKRLGLMQQQQTLSTEVVAFAAATGPVLLATFALVDCMLHRDLVRHKWRKQVRRPLCGTDQLSRKHQPKSINACHHDLVVACYVGQEADAA